MHALGHLVVDQLLQGHRMQEIEHALVEVGPQLVRHAAACFALAILLAATAGGIQGFVHRQDDVGHRNLGSFTTQGVAAAGSAGGLDEVVTAQFAKELFQIGQRNLLALADGRQSDRASLLAQGQAQTAAYATSYLGKVVSVTNGLASLEEGEAGWTYTLDAAAAEANLTVTDILGKVVFTGPAEKTAGTHEFSWDGNDNNDNALPGGAYRLTVTAAAADGARVNTSVASAGLVGQIDMTAGTPRFVIGNMTAGLGEIAAVGN